MMTKRKFHKKVLTIEILSEDSIPDNMSVSDMMNEAVNGGYSARVYGEKNTILNGKQIVESLIKQDSDPSFFQLTEKGEDLDSE